MCAGDDTVVLSTLYVLASLRVRCVTLALARIGFTFPTSRFHCDPKDPNQLRAIFSQDEVRKLYGRFQTARQREPRASEDPQ